MLALPNRDALSRSHAERPPKFQRQVRLIRKTSGRRSIGDREPFSQQSLRASNAQLLEICMWWETDTMLERRINWNVRCREGNNKVVEIKVIVTCRWQGFQTRGRFSAKPQAAAAIAAIMSPELATLSARGSGP